MKLEEALPKLKGVDHVIFKELCKAEELKDIKIAKGTGKLLEKVIGLPPGNSFRYFEDGELKTNGVPLETMFITQNSSSVDELLNRE
jgi:DNA mismatch repair protein MutH